MMKKLTIHTLKERNLIVLECISGSKAYGLDTPTSDTDIKGIFILPKEEYYALNYVGQVNDEKNDVVYYELNKFLEMLIKNNPSTIELLNTRSDEIIYKHTALDALVPSIYLTKKCQFSFGNYAISQIKKAKGLNKKVHNPIDKQRKSVLDFCYVLKGGQSIGLRKYLEERKLPFSNVGVARIDHTRGMYAMYHATGRKYKGIVSSESANELALSSIEKDDKVEAYLFFNQDAYSTYCKQYREYWDWVEERNDNRYKDTLAHGKNYDAKNMMHTFRLLKMAVEIAKKGKVNVWRSDREELLKIRNGYYSFEELMDKAEAIYESLPELYTASSLPENLDSDKINQLAFQIRSTFYNELA